MKLNAKEKEQIARNIGTYFSTNDIVNIFANSNVPTDVSLYAKWKITLDALNNISMEQTLFKILEDFCHPLNFTNSQIENARENFIETLNSILSYEDIEIMATEKNVEILSNGKPYYNFLKMFSPRRTSTDYVIEVINYFKNEYNKLKIDGLSYEYCIGENIERYNGDPSDEEIDDYNHYMSAIKQLNDVQFITEYEIISNLEGCSEIDYAICKIDESKITQPKKAPPATDEGVDFVMEKVIHHTLRFENSIQEKGIDLNHRYEKETKIDFYITKKADDFYYKGQYLKLSKKSEYYKVFCSLFAKLPEGGEITYKELTEEIRSRIPKAKSRTEEEMRKFIQDNLTGKKNGFIRYAKIPASEDNGRPLIETMRASGIAFNNKRG